MTQQDYPPDFRSLCAELLEALENAIRIIYNEDGTKHISTADFVIAKADAALARPKPPNLKEQALKELAWVGKHLDMPLHNYCNAIHTIHRALEQLPDNE